MKLTIASLLLVAFLAPLAGAQDDLDWFYVWTIYPDDAAGARLLVRPDGAGAPFTDARAPGGAPVDATVQIIMTDYSLDPLVGFPAEDLWLVSDGDALATCPGGLCPDGPTDAEGAAYWTAPGAAGGNSIGAALHVTVNGAEAQTPIPLILVSPDISGDLNVNLTDIVMFTEAIHGGELWDRGDFNNDAEVNLSDIVLFTEGIGAGCR